MNIERLDRIAKWLEAGAPHEDRILGFNMRRYFQDQRWENITDDFTPPCGAVCCIAGAAIALFKPSTPMTGRTGCFDDARELLDLNGEDAEWLFFAFEKMDPEFGNPKEQEYACRSLNEISPAWAARCIRNFIDTGKVDWIGTEPMRLHEPA